MKTLFLQQTLLSRVALFVLIISLSFSNLKAQECITPDADPYEASNYPWFGNPDYLPAFMDSLARVDNVPSLTPNISSIIPNIKWRIPIKFWIFTTGNTPSLTNLLNDGTGSNLPEEIDLQRLLDDANNAFRNTEVPSKIQFYMREAERVVTTETAPSAREIARFTQNGFGTRFHLC